MDGTRPFDMTIAAGPYTQAWTGTGGTDRPVAMSIWCRRSLAGTLPGLERFAELVLREQEAIMGAVLAARSQPRHWT